jgi:hypothetical protein
MNEINKLLVDISGLLIFKAKQMIEAAGYTWRITREDKNNFVVTRSMK